MAVRIRLQRKGARHMAFYRIVVADSRSPRDGRFIEQLGYYDPLKEPADVTVDTAKVIGWLSKGAQPSETVKSLLSRVGIMHIWHEVRRGKSLDDVRHLEDDARKRIEAQTAMLRRTREESKKVKAEAAATEKTEVESAAPSLEKAPGAQKTGEAPEEATEAAAGDSAEAGSVDTPPEPATQATDQAGQEEPAASESEKA